MQRRDTTGKGPRQPGPEPEHEPGMIYWVTGLAGTGKTTIGGLLARRLGQLGRSVVFLDGDGLRAALLPRAGNSAAERLELGQRTSQLAGLLAQQGLDVVCATLSLCPEIREQSRCSFAAYREILLSAPAAVLAERRQALHAPVEGNGAHEHGLGREEPAPEPSGPPGPDVRLENDGRRSPAELVEELLARLVGRGFGGGPPRR